MNELTNLLIAFGKIPVNNKTLIFALILLAGFLCYKFFDDRKHFKYYNDMKNEKNKEIERLADDNRRYRDIYLNQQGFAKEQIDSMSAANMKGG